MITAGVDVGIERIKIILLSDGKVIGEGMAKAGGAKRKENVDALWEKVLAESGIAASAVEKTVATGIGKFDVAFADKRVTEAIADARAARWFFPEAKTVADVGADQVVTLALGEGKEITEASLNQKCSAGVGLLLRRFSRFLGFSQEELSALPEDAAGDAVVNDNCRPFMELDAYGQLNRGASVKEVAGALINAAATRVHAVLNDKVMPPPEGAVLIGGLAGNKAFVKALEKQSGLSFLIPEKPEYAAAVGAALIAAG